ncbi:aspartate-semialdehyde dehydrogenase [Microbulbifer hydrolyticus]|uniref:Aspartate-semialdehyde dehydrogenase n=1 Tax=Microbulbifer hydrolyticus TaxID=48074 RepID=A0A6P1TD46_9GAMM|nr:Asd/ArgC dimerization domain-containing protein [Microbulbifer hydrolyticus]MBB5209840.1 aspartate-semialdehyde dehydrogenase [Microbulbifer hydrolyticus]QHQ39615.1 aspartate-semialdehyde dehydrogenase [Microbulbifer hydrolyticus]
MTESTRELVIVGVGSAPFDALLEILEERKTVTPAELKLLAADEAEVDPQVFANRSVPVQSLKEFAFTPEQVVLLLAAGETATAALAKAESAGAWVVDAAGISRGDESVALVHPLLNPALLNERDEQDRKVIAVPGAGAAMLAEALYPLKSQLQSVEVVLNQPVSALGKRSVDAAAAQTARLFNGQEPEVDETTGQRLAFNHLSSAEAPLESGHSFSELALILELRRLLGEEVALDATVNTASVFHGQLANLSVQLKDEQPLDTVRGLLANGVRLEMRERPSAQDAVGSENTLLGRLRSGLINPRQVVFCAASDNLRKDVAINCVQIVHLLLKTH